MLIVLAGANCVLFLFIYFIVCTTIWVKRFSWYRYIIGRPLLVLGNRMIHKAHLPQWATFVRTMWSTSSGYIDITGSYWAKFIGLGMLWSRDFKTILNLKQAHVIISCII